MAGPGVHDDDISVSVNGGVFLGKLSYCQLPKKDLVP
jgi:hypothetical protein